VRSYYTEWDLEGLAKEMDEDATTWFKYCVVHALGEKSREPDWSFHSSSMSQWAAVLERPIVGDDCTTEWSELTDIPETVLQKFSTMANYIHGYRIAKDFNYDIIYLGIKPKVRYGALRHVFEHSLHRWGLSNNLGKDSFAYTGPIGTCLYLD